VSDLADFTSQLEELRAKQAESEKAAVKSAADLFAANQQLISTEQALVSLQGENSKRPEHAAPAAPAPVTLPRIHIVQDGDSLVRISVEYYGTESRWQEIYDANRDLLEGDHSLRVGQRLRIP
jgi:nucleoid-associated protein YgaU